MVGRYLLQRGGGTLTGITDEENHSEHSPPNEMSAQIGISQVPTARLSGNSPSIHDPPSTIHYPLGCQRPLVPALTASMDASQISLKRSSSSRAPTRSLVPWAAR